MFANPRHAAVFVAQMCIKTIAELLIGLVKGYLHTFKQLLPVDMRCRFGFRFLHAKVEPLSDCLLDKANHSKEKMTSQGAV
eukprot:5854814-Amphidinium_carterae.1